MIKIDGDKVKFIREEKGFTQLYISSIVEVTTDTISRWENKRYPTIKKANAVKLAEALEVDISCITEGAGENSNEDKQDEVQTSQPLVQKTKEANPSPIKNRKFFQRYFFILVLIIIALLFTAVYLKKIPSKNQLTKATRYLPAHHLRGLPFPVSIQIEVIEDKNGILVIKETLPSQTTVLSSDPPIELKNLQDNILKWLNKSPGNSSISYIIVMKARQQQADTPESFNGQITGKSQSKATAISGNNITAPSNFHWADINKDNKIDDKEILVAYDLYGNIPGLNFNEVEEIWHGSGYTFDNKTGKITINGN